MRIRAIIAVAVITLAACSDATETDEDVPEVAEAAPTAGYAAEWMRATCVRDERLAGELGASVHDPVAVAPIPGVPLAYVFGPAGERLLEGQDIHPCSDDEDSFRVTRDMPFVVADLRVLASGYSYVDAPTAFPVVGEIRYTLPGGTTTLMWLRDGAVDIFVFPDGERAAADTLAAFDELVPS